jgi:hypothetical protein
MTEYEEWVLKDSDNENIKKNKEFLDEEIPSCMGSFILAFGRIAYEAGQQSERAKRRDIPVTENSKSIRCNHCMSIFYEEYIIKDDNTESGERCPVCGKNDALMDITVEKNEETEKN